jgi:drug/metabolite transporter (DMT)-like permease
MMGGKMNTNSKKWIGSIAILLSAACYGLLNTVIKLAFDAGLTPVMVIFSQLTIGATVMWLLLFVRKEKLTKLSRIDIIKIVLLGFTGLTLTSFLSNLALERLSTALSIVLLFQSTWMTIALEWILAKNRPRTQQLFAATLVLIGTILAVGLTGKDLHELSVTGILFGLSSGFTFSLFLFASSKLGTTVNAIQKSAIMLTGSIVISIPLLPVLLSDQWITPTVALLTWLKWGIALAVVGSILPLILLNWGIARTGSTLGAILSPFEIPVTGLIAWAVLGESMRYEQGVGICLVLAGIIYAEIPIKWGKSDERLYFNKD